MKLYTIAKHRIHTDGSGITDLVALKGCPLACKYCINRDILASDRCVDRTAEELLADLMQDACYMIATEGGVTFGGGEPLLQADELLRFAQIRPDWMHMNIETSLNVSGEAVRALRPYVDYWIVDVKTLDPEVYLSYTGRPINQVIDNLALLDPEKCKVRIPVIPGFKDEETAEREAAVIREQGFTNVEVFPYVVRA